MAGKRSTGPIPNQLPGLDFGLGETAELLRDTVLSFSQDHIDGYNHFLSMAKGMGADFELIDPQECGRRHPLITTDGLMGALWDPLDGDIDPAQLCQALARRSRKAGAEIYRQTPVTGLTQTAGGEWTVHTPKGDIVAEHIVNAGGYRCNEVGAMIGVEHPVVSMEHQYFLTEPITAIAELGHRVPLIRCPTDDFYTRQEKHGLLIGCYEQGCKTWGLDGIDPNFSNDLCPNDLDRCLDVMAGTFERLPCLTETGIHTIINGPITYTPDGLPLVGRIPGRRNAWCITGLRAGLGEGGGHGWLLAQQIVHGEACYDTWCLDPRRFTAHADVAFTALKAVEDYQNEFRFHMPHEFRPAGREAKTTPLYPVLKAAGAAFGVVNGWERATYYKPAADFAETHTFRFPDWHGVVAGEVQAVRDRVGIMEVSGFNRYEISGHGARDWLDRLSCSRVPRKTGKVGLAYFLNPHGNVLGEATLANLAEDRIWYGSAAAAEYHDWDWLNDNAPPAGVTLTSLTNAYTILVVAGPRARDVVASAAPLDDWSREAFPWLSCREISIGDAPAVAMSVSFSGELGFELHIPNDRLCAVHDALRAAGEEFGMAPFGLFATDSMRLEKGYRHWKADLITEFNPIESGLERFVDRDKPDYVGRAGLEKQLSAGLKRTFVSLVIDSDFAPAHPGDSMMIGDAVVGTVTSAGYGHRVQENLAMGFVDPPFGDVGAELDILVIGKRLKTRVVEECRYDPTYDRVRS